MSNLFQCCYTFMTRATLHESEYRSTAKESLLSCLSTVNLQCYNSNKRPIFILLRLKRNVLVVLLRCNVMYFKSPVVLFFPSGIISDRTKRITAKLTTFLCCLHRASPGNHTWTCLPGCVSS